MNTNKKRNIIVFIAFICGFLWGGKVGIDFSIISRNAGPASILFLFYGFMGGGFLAGVVLFAHFVWKRLQSQVADIQFFTTYISLTKKQQLFIKVFVNCMLIVYVLICVNDIVPDWEPTQEKAYAERMSSDETPYSELNILLKKEYKDCNLVLAFDKENQLHLYEFEKRTKNGTTEYKCSFVGQHGILSEDRYIEDVVADITIISKVVTKRKNISYGATYSDISNLRINGEKPDYIIEEEINGRKVNVWFYEDLGDDFTIKDVEIEL